MSSLLRKSPPICIVFAMLKLLLGILKLSKKNIGYSVMVINNQRYTIFRHITIHPLTPNKENLVFCVSFKFSRLTHRANKIASLIPMLMISGFPGFQVKMYAANKKSGYWQGMYQWQSVTHLEEYKNSFVFKMMNRRALPGSINSIEFNNSQLINIIH